MVDVPHTSKIKIEDGWARAIEHAKDSNQTLKECLKAAQEGRRPIIDKSASVKAFTIFFNSQEGALTALYNSFGKNISFIVTNDLSQRKGYRSSITMDIPATYTIKQFLNLLGNERISAVRSGRNKSWNKNQVEDECSAETPEEHVEERRNVSGRY